MATEVLMRNKYTGEQKKGFYGFSWTYFLFGFFVPMVRGDVGEGLKHLALALVTFGIYPIVQIFIYNKTYTRSLMGNGWELAGTPEQNQMAAAALGMGMAPMQQMQQPMMGAPQPMLVQAAPGQPMAQGIAVPQAQSPSVGGTQQTQQTQQTEEQPVNGHGSTQQLPPPGAA